MTTLGELLCDVLDKAVVTPTLVDVGASGGAPNKWKMIANSSTYVAFDPDSRDFSEKPGGDFKNSVTIPHAVVGSEDKEVTFYLTRSPYCSSTLEPYEENTSQYAFSQLFDVVRTAKATSTTLSEAMKTYQIGAIDWLKVDSQGADLAILKGLGHHIEDVVACELEPGFLPFYKGESVFRDIDSFMTSHGFWLAHLEMQSSVRVRPETIRMIFGDNRNPNDEVFGVSPIAPEPLYFRPLGYFKERRDKTRSYVVAWVAAMIAGKVGFALELARGLFETGEAVNLARYMVDICKSVVAYKDSTTRN